ncbi:MAG: hypothetical protein SVX43_09445 [Cyanobacteriota bacterium]|nr:hypothetical protein [Cyanobacteriota bacterium]
MPDESQEQPEASPTLSKREALTVLRETIQRLEGLVDRLDAAKTLETLPPTATTDALQRSLDTLETSIEAIAPPVPPTPKSSSGFDRLLALWAKLLDRIRTLLPASLNEKLSDWAISGLLAALTLLIFSTAIALLPDRAEPPLEPVAVVETPPPAIENPPIEEPEVSPEPEIPPELEAPIEVEVPTEPEIFPEPEIPETSEIPDELEATEEPEPVAVEPPPPPPEPVLTPEQRLIAAIEAQVAELTSQYADGLIDSIEADFVGSRLKVAIADDWYQFTPTRQDRVSREMWERSQELDFRNLEIVDLQGNLLARSPVVGKEMVIFARSRSLIQ